MLCINVRACVTTGDAWTVVEFEFITLFFVKRLGVTLFLKKRPGIWKFDETGVWHFVWRPYHVIVEL